MTAGNYEKKSVGGFYQIDAEGDNEIAEHGGSRLVLVRWALRRHQQRQNPELVSAGRPALRKTLGMSAREAMRALDELRSIAWGPEPDQCAMIDAARWNGIFDSADQVPLGRYGANKVMPYMGDRLVALPNQLNMVHEGQAKSPLQQLYDLRDDTLRDDTVSLLRGLYEHLDLKLYGGVDPSTAMYIPWRTKGSARAPSGSPIELGYLGEEHGLHFWAVDSRTTDESEWNDHGLEQQWSFVEDVTGESRGEQPNRFLAAVNELSRLGFLYHAAIVFDRDPTNDRNANLLYPLWIFSESERKRLKQRGAGQQGLASHTMRKAITNGLSGDIEAAQMDSFSHDGRTEGPLGFFVVVGDTDRAKVLGIFRPRFIPNTMDSQAGWSELKAGAEEWRTQLLDNPR